MHTREIKVSIKVVVPKVLVDSSDEPYFYKLGFEKEAEVLANEVEHGIEAWFDGFELLEPVVGAASAAEAGTEEMVLARLHYTVLVERT